MVRWPLLLLVAIVAVVVGRAAGQWSLLLVVDRHCGMIMKSHDSEFETNFEQF